MTSVTISGITLCRRSKDSAPVTLFPLQFGQPIFLNLRKSDPTNHTSTRGKGPFPLHPLAIQSPEMFPHNVFRKVSCLVFLPRSRFARSMLIQAILVTVNKAVVSCQNLFPYVPGCRRQSLPSACRKERHNATFVPRVRAGFDAPQ